MGDLAATQETPTVFPVPFPLALTVLNSTEGFPPLLQQKQKFNLIFGLQDPSTYNGCGHRKEHKTG